MKNETIDFVILWVDGNDPEWQQEKSLYEDDKQSSTENIDNNQIRYRDWDNLKYWFRGVETFAPWVNKIHFITCGHLPDWLDVNNPKLNIVKHSDYMPKEALPTFNSNAIELLIHKIEGLSEKFVLFNDDLFLIDEVTPGDFFKRGKPCNSMALMPIIPNSKRKHYKTISNNMAIINKHFNFKKSVSNNLTKYLSLKQGKYIFKTYPLLLYNEFVGFANFHLTISYLKSTFEEVWTLEEEKLNQTVYSRFRDYENNVSHWLFNYWQFAKGDFYQKKVDFGVNMPINGKRVSDIIINQKYKMIGLGDSDHVDNFEELKKQIIDSFEKILPEKSSFEK